MEIFIGLLTTVFILLIMGILISKYADYYVNHMHFECPCCRMCFKLSKFEFIFSLKTGKLNERIVLCPYCGYRGVMLLIED